MHVHACKNFIVRTTIELSSRQRAQLLRLATERGQKGFSGLVQEAVDRYLENEATRRERVAAALSVLGTIDDETEEHLREAAREARGAWR